MQIKLTPDAKQSEALNATMQRFNDACNWVAERAFERQLANRFKLHKLYYYDVRSTFDLPANFACAVFARVAAVLRRDKRVKPSFKPRASLPYDARLLRFLNLHEVVFRDGAYYLMAVVEHTDEPPVTPDDFLGVDMGVVNIATDSDGEVHSGQPLDRVRMRYAGYGHGSKRPPPNPHDPQAHSAS